MTLYLDTSSVVKLYVDEPGSDEVKSLLDASDEIATSWLTYTEFRAALARRRRERAITARALTLAKEDFEADWPRYFAIRPTPALCRTAGGLAERYQLRAYDSVHLASYGHIVERVGVRQVEFSGFDAALNRAAHSLRRRLLRKRQE